MPATSREGIDVIGENGPRPDKRRGRNRNTLRNRNSKRSGGRGTGRRASRGAKADNFWRRFERLMGDEVEGLRVSLGDGKRWKMEREGEDTPQDRPGNRGGEGLGGLTQGGNQEQAQSGGEQSRKRATRTNTGRSTAPVTPPAPTQPAPLATSSPAIPAPMPVRQNPIAELARLANEKNPKTANRNAARGEYPPALSAVPRGMRDDVMDAARRTGLKPGVIAAVGQVESDWRKNATSSAGARGPMQTMPFWSDAANDPKGRFNPNKRPRRAIMLGAEILDSYIEQQGGLRKGLQAYNAGPGNMPAGADYARKVMQTLRQIRRR